MNTTSEFHAEPTAEECAAARTSGKVLVWDAPVRVGHNPLGALAIVAMLGLTLAIAGSGWAVFNQAGGEWLEEAHELAANVMMGIVGLHLTGVLLASWSGRENLVGAMVTGRKAGRPEDGVRSAWRSVALLMVVAVLGFWWLQWQSPPDARSLADPAAVSATKHRDRDKD